MKISVLLFVASIFTGATAQASLPIGAVGKVDAAREGNLSSLVLESVKKDLGTPCGDDPESVKGTVLAITKLDSGSANQTKQPGTPYDYEANYLVTLKCHTGTTYQGAYIELMKATIYHASFDAEYDAAGGPKTMNNLKIELVRDVDLSVKR